MVHHLCVFVELSDPTYLVDFIKKAMEKKVHSKDISCLSFL